MALPLYAPISYAPQKVGLSTRTSTPQETLPQPFDARSQIPSAMLKTR